MDNSDGSFSMGEEPKGYAITGKIMLSAIVILFSIVIFMVLLHLYARWYITRVRRIDTTRRRNRVNRHTQIVFYVDNHLPGSAQVVNRGLEPEVLKSLPVFVYRSQKPDQDGPGPVSECAVCLSEFEEGETGRVLPKCNHSFHIECIDMWFHSHSTCPLCRSPVEPVQEVVCSQTGFDIGGPVQDEPGSSSCHCGDGEVSRRKTFDFSAVRIDIPRRTELENEISLSSSPHSHSFRSPGSRLSSIKRILSMNKKSPKGAATSSGLGTSCGDSVNGEFELESGLTQGQIHH